METESNLSCPASEIHHDQHGLVEAGLTVKRVRHVTYDHELEAQQVPEKSRGAPGGSVCLLE